MFKFFKKKDNFLYNPIKGEIISLEMVGDGVFSNKLLGDGFATIPVEGDVFSPVYGKITSIFPTKHAIGLLCQDGKTEILLHMGLDTVELNGEGFNILVKTNDIVTPKTLIAKMDISKISQKEKKTTVMTVVTTQGQTIENLEYGNQEVQKKIANIF